MVRSHMNAVNLRRVIGQDKNGYYNIPPYFFASPNPFLEDIVTISNKVKEVDKPYENNISAGKNSYVYDAHTYHTKVPPEGIKKLISYYTNPGDVILDPFCGSGMTGIAATELGRKAILCDLSPSAAFIAYNLNVPLSSNSYMESIKQTLNKTSDLEKLLYNTKCRTCGREVPMLYMIWSYGLICPSCNLEFKLWDVALDEKATSKESKIKSEFECPNCGKFLHKRTLKRTKRYPVAVGYKCCKGGLKEEVKPVDNYDLEKLNFIQTNGIPDDLWYPSNNFPSGVNTRQPISFGITSVDKAYTMRALWAMSSLWDLAAKCENPDIRSKLFFTLTSLYKRVTVFSEFRFWGGSGNTANYNVPMIMNEQNVYKTYARKAKTIKLYYETTSNVQRDVRISTQSSCNLPQIPDKSVDYVFTDPPFGSNINYSEMNFLWESWLGIFTNNSEEAIINRVQKKSVNDYRILLARVFSEVRRVLKDGGWFSIMFHNSSEDVWKALQNSLMVSGFEIEGVQLFDKKHGTFKQFVSENAVGYDLVIHCRKSLTHKNGKRNAPNRAELINFIKDELKARDRYLVKYLHVHRTDELDYRKLYAEWLKKNVGDTVITISFREFRDTVNKIENIAQGAENETS